MNYYELKFCLKSFNKLKVEKIGRSEDDRNIYSLSALFGEKRDWVIFQGAIHAREHLSTDLIIALAKKIEYGFEDFKKNKNFPNICFLPMINPDGVQIAHYGRKIIKNRHLNNGLKKIIAKYNYKMYKSNAKGVDLNNNFDAMWDRFQNSNNPSTHGYIGKFVFSERETRALARITLKKEPKLTISYHLKGEEIYYGFYQSKREFDRDKKIAEIVSEITGYKIKSTQNVSSGGYKDWCVYRLHIPSLTIEVGRDKIGHPVPRSEIYDIIAKNIGIIDKLCDILKIIKG